MNLICGPIKMMMNDTRPIVLIATGRPFHKFTIRLKMENLKTTVLKQPLTSVASVFLISYLYDLKLTYDRTSKSMSPLRHLKRNKSKTSLLNSRGKRPNLAKPSG